MKKTVLALSIIFIAAGASAHTFNPEDLESGNLQHYQEEMNIYSDQVPDFMSSIIGNQTLNLRIENENASTKEVGVKLEGVAVKDMQMDGYENATLEVNTSVKQINNITTSDQPLKTLNRELESGDIEYRSNGMLNSLRTFFAQQMLSIVSTL